MAGVARRRTTVREDGCAEWKVPTGQPRAFVAVGGEGVPGQNRVKENSLEKQAPSVHRTEGAWTA